MKCITYFKNGEIKNQSSYSKKSLDEGMDKILRHKKMTREDIDFQIFIDTETIKEMIRNLKEK